MEPPPIVTPITIFSLLTVLILLLAAYVLSLTLLPRSTSTTLRSIYIWHLFDALIHFTLEGSYLYNCFFVHVPTDSLSTITSAAKDGLVIPHNNFLSRTERTYGALYGESPSAALWREYALADKRWGGADPTVISLELLTVFIGGPLAVYCAECIRRGDLRRGWFWMVVLATGELYGGFMTFCPEWLTGSLNLDTSNFMYLWVYLFFFNTLWVVFPIYVLVAAYRHITHAFMVKEKISQDLKVMSARIGEWKAR
ncbi:MAG: hypothetical protein M1817_004627 [Caeruleum heppii]|nr:MAG: hypothetical protein M1817_004627 [Caeruleum heppii]